MRGSSKWRCARINTNCSTTPVLPTQCVQSVLSAPHCSEIRGRIPVRMFWKASSTLLASKADVSMNERLFSPRGWLSAAVHRATYTAASRESDVRTRKLFGLLGGHCPQMPQIALVSNQHDDDVRVGMVAQLPQPPCDVLVGLVLADVVDEQRSHGATVVGRCDGAVALLAGCVPNLCLDRLGVHLDGAGRELDADGRLGVEVELVAGESAQQVGFTDT